MSQVQPWYGVYLDCLALGWQSSGIGAPNKRAVHKVQDWLEIGADVRVLTWRVGGEDDAEVRTAIRQWCVQHIGAPLEATNVYAGATGYVSDDTLRLDDSQALERRLHTIWMDKEHPEWWD